MRPQLYRRSDPRPGEPIFAQWTSDNWLWSAGQVSEFLRMSKRAARRLVWRLVREGQIARYR